MPPLTHKRKPLIRVVPLWLANTVKDCNHVIDTTSKGGIWSDLSPFKLGPCYLYGGRTAVRMENAWQFSKVYSEHLVYGTRMVSQKYWLWAEAGWADTFAHRYPMGKGRKPEFSLWDGEWLTYVEARKKIYGPLYIEAVMKTEDFSKLKEMYDAGESIALLDYDAYDHAKMGMTLTNVLNHPGKKAGHAFFLAMLLQNDPALLEMDLR